MDVFRGIARAWHTGRRSDDLVVAKVRGTRELKSGLADRYTAGPSAELAIRIAIGIRGPTIVDISIGTAIGGTVAIGRVRTPIIRNVAPGPDASVHHLNSSLRLRDRD